MEAIIDVVLLSFLVAVVIAIVWMKDLFTVAMLAGIYGLLTASFFVAMDAVDVAFTEASVGAGISTLLMLVVIAKTGRYERPVRHKPWLALVVVLVTGGLLIYGTFDMPYFGSAQAPAQLNETTAHYIDDSFEEIGIPNIVTSVLASYRAFDTFGEVVVIFTAGIGILALLSGPARREEDADIDAINETMHKEHMVLRIVAKILIPFILIFALYVQFHGDYGPGGGFQAGVIFAAAIILYSMLFGLDTARQVINQAWVRLIAAIGVLLYGSVGMVSFLNGGTFLDYNVLMEDPIAGQHLGIILIELGVGLTVTAVMTIIFFNFAGRQVPVKKTDNNQGA
ncbi:Na(+)/H(+) antiporter subunit B [Marinicella sp. S1101]|uniref:Na(+)/H(+) antiporter subunit B n=1 Tax=Marinicella marina TaxID=2996016 RepID=UPI0022610428|nr:Na(+)/H(+) antiporter subunit B [Marinicella marina]MCX7555057.1 Na(+)/H(+) antiporter subunit B [Marinicella marina]MDJ1141365.1 Na(+)/H(+) antiporter subunit B [Marinicella marina]